MIARRRGNAHRPTQRAHQDEPVWDVLGDVAVVERVGPPGRDHLVRLEDLTGILRQVLLVPEPACLQVGNALAAVRFEDVHALPVEKIEHRPGEISAERVPVHTGHFVGMVLCAVVHHRLHGVHADRVHGQVRIVQGRRHDVLAGVPIGFEEFGCDGLTPIGGLGGKVRQAVPHVLEDDLHAARLVNERVVSIGLGLREQ